MIYSKEHEEARQEEEEVTAPEEVPEVLAWEHDGGPQEGEGGILKDGAGQGDPLTLPAGESLAPLTDKGVVAVGQLVDEPRRLRQLGSPFNRTSQPLAEALTPGRIGTRPWATAGRSGT